MKAIEKVISHARRHHDMLHYPASRVERMVAGSKSIDELRLKCPGLLKKARAVEIEAYKIKGYMRLVPFKTLLAGTYKSRHVILDLVGLHFKKRYPAYHVITWNETRRDGCVSVPDCSPQVSAILELIALFPVNIGFTGDVLIRGGLHLFQLPPTTSFVENFLPRLIELLFPGTEAATAHVHDKREFETRWAAFYDTQVLESRINYKRAMGLIGKRQLLDQVGVGSIEAQRVLRKVPKGCKTLLDFIGM
ncbi:MAG: DUF4130 domain-containing protein [Candidatus Sigynarchaeota archaeon]